MPAADSPSRERIGPYTIVARVGAGGMGEVFKAWDPRLERDVAIKLLHPEMAADPDRQKRLVAEGRAASALNHPSIVRVYDADVDGESYYLVSEWLEGASMRHELSRGTLPLKRLLDLAVQIADGLAAAHAHGIVHRDIKPENIMLARDGSARIVDFGLARSDPHAPARAAVIGHASTVTASLEGGLSGTPAYMSPEQARGTAGDFRTDQFSFGALLYEMATGKYAFRRDTVADTLAAVLHDEPQAIATLNPRIPAPVTWIIEQCLAKDVADRYGATEDLAKELRRVRDRLREVYAEQLPAAAGQSRRWALPLTAVVAATVTAAAILAVPGSTATLRFAPIASGAAYEGSPSWSNDGRSLAYVTDVDGVLQVFVKRAGDAISQQVTRGRFDAERPFWAPNGERLYFISLAGDREALWSVGVAGGTPTLVAENVNHAAIDPSGARLALIVDNPDDFSQHGLWWSSPPGAPLVRESAQPADTVGTVAAQLAFAPDGRLLIWTSGLNGVERADDGPTIERFYLYDPAGGRSPRRVLGHLTRTTNLPAFTWLADNRHVVLALPDERLGNRHLWIADTESETLRQITATHTNETTPAASWGDGRVAYATDEVDFDLVLISPDGRTREVVLETARNEYAPVWSPSGDQFAFATDRSGALEIWSRSRDGQWERPIVSAGDFGSVTESLGSLAFSPDGRTLAYQRSSAGAFEVWLSPVTGGKPVRLVETVSKTAPYQDSPAWSPDGTWVSFRDWDTGNQQSPTTSFSSVLKKARVGTGESIDLGTIVAGYSPTRWSLDGQWILVTVEGGLARIASDGGTPEVISTDRVIDFAWAPDSRRVYALAESDDIAGHFALIEIDSAARQSRELNADLGAIPVANQPIRGFSFLPGRGFLTSLASARSDIWLLEGFEHPARWPFSWFRR